MFRLYNEYGAANFPGGTLSDLVSRMIYGFMAEHPDADLNDVENIIGQTAGAVLAEMRLRHAHKMREKNSKTLKLAKLGA